MTSETSKTSKTSETSESRNETNLLVIDRNECIYTSCYCEENIWKLCHLISVSQRTHLNNCFVVFISNDNKMVPIWKQRSGNEKEDFLCVWDYHVIMVYSICINERISSKVYDFDTILEFPEDFRTYSHLTLRTDDLFKDKYRRLMRVVSAQQYLDTFASNRSHMKTPNGSWIKPPPNYPSIVTNNCINNLNQFIQMNYNPEFGTVLTLNQFNQRFDKI